MKNADCQFFLYSCSINLYRKELVRKGNAERSKLTKKKKEGTGIQFNCQGCLELRPWYIGSIQERLEHLLELETNNGVGNGIGWH